MAGKARILHISIDSEIDPVGCDLRTKEGNEKHIIMQIKKYGGFSIFWVTENQKRASAADKLIESGKIIRQKDHYPWCAYEISSSHG